MDRFELKQKYGDEEVLVMHYKSEFIKDLKQGFIPMGYNILDSLVKDCFFLPRYLVEYNPQFRQPIPYILVKYEDKYFVTKRLMNSGEARLVNKVSMSVGGHINPIDESPSKDVTTIVNALYRELFEELEIKEEDIVKIHLEGIINDLSNNVSQDHIGVVYTVEVNNPYIAVKERDKLIGNFYPMDEIEIFNINNMLESWSEIVFDYLTDK